MDGGPYTSDQAEKTELNYKAIIFSVDIEEKHLIKAIVRLDN